MRKFLAALFLFLPSLAFAQAKPPSTGGSSSAVNSSGVSTLNLTAPTLTLYPTGGTALRRLLISNGDFIQFDADGTTQAESSYLLGVTGQGLQLTNGASGFPSPFAAFEFDAQGASGNVNFSMQTGGFFCTRGGVSCTGSLQYVSPNLVSSDQVKSALGYKVSTATLTEAAGGDLTLLITNDAAGPGMVIKNGVALNAGSSYLRLLKNNDVVDFNFKTGGELDSNGSALFQGGLGSYTAYLTEDGTTHDVTMAADNDAAGPAIILKGKNSLNSGSSIVRMLRSNNVIDFNFKTGGNLVMNGWMQLGGGTAVSLPTCGAGNDWIEVPVFGGVTGVRGSKCICTNDGAGTYKWQNQSPGFASAAASLGTTTTCPNSP